MVSVMVIMNTVAMRAACSRLAPNASTMGRVKMLKALKLIPKLIAITTPRPTTRVQAWRVLEVLELVIMVW